MSETSMTAPACICRDEVIGGIRCHVWSPSCHAHPLETRWVGRSGLTEEDLQPATEQSRKEQYAQSERGK